MRYIRFMKKRIKFKDHISSCLPVTALGEDSRKCLNALSSTKKFPCKTSLHHLVKRARVSVTSATAFFKLLEACHFGVLVCGPTARVGSFVWHRRAVGACPLAGGDLQTLTIQGEAAVPGSFGKFFVYVPGCCSSKIHLRRIGCATPCVLANFHDSSALATNHREPYGLKLALLQFGWLLRCFLDTLSPVFPFLIEVLSSF